jgi:1-acyl-sn-glycerol-3-phosphate acyltransferase
VRLPIDPSIRARVERIEIPWNPHGIDPYGVSKSHLAQMYTTLGWLYRRYFRVDTFGAEHVPLKGRAMLIGNHSGGVAIDGAMLITSAFMALERPRLAQGMVEKFMGRMPFSSLWQSRTGQFTGLPETAERLLNDDRLLMVFPEGARGTAKLYWERHSLVEFGTGFMRLAMKTHTPIVPVAILGGGEALPTVANSYALGALVGAPYVPVPAYLVPVPLPAKMEVHYGAPMEFAGTGHEDDDVINANVEQVKRAIATMLRGRLRELGREPAEGLS